MSADGSLPAAGLGHNNPPEPTPFEIARNAIDTLVDVEGRNWLDGTPIADQAQADSVGLLLDSLRRARDEADAARVKENEPFDKGKAEVQERYAPLIADTKAKKGKVVTAISACKALLDAWLEKEDARKRALAAAAQAEADRKAELAADAMRQADPTDLNAQESAEALVQEAKRAGQTANRAASDRATVAGGARAISRAKAWKATLTARRDAMIHYWVERPKAFDGVLQQLADADVRAGKRRLPGFDITEEGSVR